MPLLLNILLIPLILMMILLAITSLVDFVRIHRQKMSWLNRQAEHLNLDPQDVETFIIEAMRDRSKLISQSIKQQSEATHRLMLELEAVQKKRKKVEHALTKEELLAHVADLRMRYGTLQQAWSQTHQLELQLDLKRDQVKAPDIHELDDFTNGQLGSFLSRENFTTQSLLSFIADGNRLTRIPGLGLRREREILWWLVTHHLLPMTLVPNQHQTEIKSRLTGKSLAPAIKRK